MNILVTGAAGFIGSTLAEKLARRGDAVVGLDNFDDYYDPAKKRANARRLLAHSNVRMVEADVRSESTDGRWRVVGIETFSPRPFDDRRGYLLVPV